MLFYRSVGGKFWRKLCRSRPANQKFLCTEATAGEIIFPSEFPPIAAVHGAYHRKILNQLEKIERRRPGRIAFKSVANNSEMSYAALIEKSYGLASYLKINGFQRGDVCCLVLPNCAEFAVSFLGSALAGGAYSAASSLFTDYELQRQFIDSNASFVVANHLILEKVRKAVEGCPNVKKILCVDGHREIANENVVHFDAVCETNISQFHDAESSSEDLLFLPYSSGTTGAPKGVMLTHTNYGTMCDSFKDHFSKNIDPHLLGGSPDFMNENVLGILPFYHLLGNILMIKGLLEGSTQVLLPKFDPEAFCSSIERYKMKQLYIVPPILLFMAKSTIPAKYDLSSVQHIGTAAAPLGRDVIAEFHEKYPEVRCVGQGFGMSECGMATLPVWQPESFDACGKAVGTCELKIVDIHNAHSLGPGERGEVCVRSQQVMKGYLNRPEETSATVDGDGWLHTGDIGYVDQDNLLYIVDRLKELIKVKGLQVPPAELENLLLSHPMIGDVAVIGVRCERSGEVPKAFVVRKNSSLSHNEVIEFVKDKVSPYKQLAGGVQFVEEIPKSPSGKILRRIIMDEMNK